MTPVQLVSVVLAQAQQSPWFGVPAQLAALLGGLAGLAALVTGFATRRKIAAEATKTNVDAVAVLNETAVGLLDPFKEQVSFLRAELASTRSELASARSELQTLRHQVAELNEALENERRQHGRTGG